MAERMQGWIGQLRERHVFRTAVLYIGGAWIVAQVGDFAIQNYDLHRRYLDVVLYLLTVGLPAALVIAWYHGHKGVQKVKRAEAVMLVLLALAGIAGSALLLGRAIEEQERAAVLLPAATTDLGNGSVAILPLANNTGADSLDWLGTGLADMLTTNLAQLQSVRVVGVERLLDLMRQANAQASERIPDDLALDIAQASGARLMVRGSIARSGTNLRMDLRLIDLSDGTVIAGVSARGEDVYELVDDLSGRLSPHILGGAVQPTELTPIAQLATGSLDAFREYREGIRAERLFHRAEAVEHYRAAVEIDSTFAVAWLRLGLAGFQGDGNIAEASQAMAQAERFIDRTSERDRLMIEAMMSFVRFDAATTEERLTQLIARYPDDKEARTWLAMLYNQTDRQDARQQVLEEIIRLDPFYAPAYNELAYSAARAGDTVAADTLSLRYLELEPDQPNPHDSRGEILEMLGRPDEGLEAFRQAIAVDPGFVVGYKHIVRWYLREGDLAGARTELAAQLRSEDPDVSIWIRLLSGDTYVAEGRYLDGLDSYEQAAARARELDRNGLRLVGLLDAGTIAVALGAFDRASAAFEESRTLDPYNQETFFGSLTALGLQGRVDQMRVIRDAVSEGMVNVPGGFREFAEISLRYTDALIAFYAGDLAGAVERFEEAQGGSALQYTFREQVDALLQLERGEDAVRAARRVAGAHMIRTDERIFPFVEQDRLYWMARAYEATGDLERAVRGYERLHGMASDGLRQVPWMADTEERLARLKEAEASRGEP
jgi:tetratricopeptide (TPR) repeat protein